MTKAELVNEISEKTKLDKEEVLRVVETFMTTVMANMIKGENIYLRGFGGFILKKRAAKVARHIKNNVQINIPAQYIPSFKPAKVFTTRVKKNVSAAKKELNNEID